MSRVDLDAWLGVPNRRAKPPGPRRHRTRHRCGGCGKTFPPTFVAVCDDCGHLVEVEHDLEAARLRESLNPYHRFRDLLPVADVRLLPENARYTPAIHATRLGAAIGLSRLHLKNETVLPTGTTKDRMAAVALAFLFECGTRAFCTSSTGNSSTAYCHAIDRFPGLTLHLFTAERFLRRVEHAGRTQVVHRVLRGATFVEAFDFAKRFAVAHGLVPERGFFNPGRREGLKLAFLEAVDQLPRAIDWYVQAVSSGMGVYGTFKGAEELRRLGHVDRLPRLLCVQQETCAPMARAWRDGSPVIRPEHVVRHPTGIAEAILRGDPTGAYPYVRQIVRRSAGAIVAVSETEVREAHRMVEELEGLRPCFSAATAVAGLIRHVRAGAIPRDDTVLVNLTGRDRPAAADVGGVHWLVRFPNGWAPAPGEPPMESA